MSDDAPNTDETPVTFNIKSSADAKYVITIPLSTTVSDLKQKLSTSDYADIPTDRQRLIYSGRVLKDADTLASYKIKEGNTIHLVKGAASNQRQNPPNSGTSNVPGSSPPAGGVPTNIAAGTGRDPLAALTGARYAGYAQMPNANMFGPDGGMGPPPDPDQFASMLENPQFASQFSEALSNPDVIEQMVRMNPMFQGPMAQQAREMLRDPAFRRMMTDPETLRSMMNMRRNMPGLFGGMGGMGGAGGGNQAFPMPGTAEGGGNAAEGQQDQDSAPPQPQPNPFAMFGNPAAGTGAGAGAAANPFASIFAGGSGPMGGDSRQAESQGAPSPTPATATNSGQNPPQQQGQQAAQNPFAATSQMFAQNPQMMQQMMASMGLGQAGALPGPNNPNAGGANPQQAQYNPFAALQAMGALNGGGLGGFNAPPQPQDDRPPEERYAEQLRQLNDMGFYEFERNVEALRRTGGSVQGAVEYLLTH
ncbi:uncharacterized protein KY384_001454 [Bacidia gigantensis]|uniref:uncharacterized protein n=1 Tax=Bacidia gigantensis TaxID=2732470 RepID=UPI001D03BA95|nr:uncharacterized protein KY384_001454 [Bacidia gigantensis]KAG8533713.1 hypothetical protein KY384_001454 [Bacidia gigantensis]